MATKMEERRGGLPDTVGFAEAPGDYEIADIGIPTMGAAMPAEKEGERRPAAPSGGDGGRETVSCLSSDKVIVRFIPHPDSMADNPKHVLYGGMAEDSVRTYTVPVLSNGSLKNVLTKAEKEFLEEYLGLEYNAMSVHNKTNNYWHNFQVRLRKQDNTLDLSDPYDYIKYKVLLANTELIAPSIEVMQDRPKGTYEFVIIRENEEVSDMSRKLDLKMRLYMEFGKISEDRRTLLTVIRLIDNKIMSKKVKTAFLQTEVSGYIESKPKLLLSTLTDPLLKTKSDIFSGVELGFIAQRGDQFFVKDGNVPMCGDGADPTLSNAARWLNLPRNSTTYNLLQMRIKKETEAA